MVNFNNFWERWPGYSKKAQQEFMENIRKLEEQPQSSTKQILMLNSEHLGEWHQIDPPNIEQGVDKNLTLSQTIDSTNLNVENTPLSGNDNPMPLGTPSSLVVQDISDRKDDTDKCKKLTTFTIKATRNSYFSFQTNDPLSIIWKNCNRCFMLRCPFFFKMEIFYMTPCALLKLLHY